jgi:GMP synthase (glutamine-hydrolysing)
MLKLLIIDSNPNALNEEIRAIAGTGLGEGYAAVLHALEQDLETEVIAPYDGDPLPDPDSFDGVVFTGSSVDWHTDDARAEPLAAIMRTVFQKGIPTLGSCNGMQLAASVLGGSSRASPKGREDGLASHIQLSEQGKTHPMMTGRKQGYAVPCTHRDEVIRLPEGAVLLSGNNHSKVQAFSYTLHGVCFWGMQYHPEFSTEFIGAYLQDKDRVPPQTIEDLKSATRDKAAAERLGTSCADQHLSGRTLELQNWLNMLHSLRVRSAQVPVYGDGPDSLVTAFP